MELTTTRLILREFCEDDLGAVLEYESNPETHRFEKAIPDATAIKARLDQKLAWAQENPRRLYCLAITIPPEDVVRGQVCLSVSLADIREWEIGWKVHYSYWGNGYATEAAKGMLAFGFEELQAHRIVALCHVQNEASIRVMQKLGMSQEGRLRESRWWNDTWQNEYIYSILDHEWEANKC